MLAVISIIAFPSGPFSMKKVQCSNESRALLVNSLASLDNFEVLSVALTPGWFSFLPRVDV